MSKLQMLNMFVTERLSAAAVEIFGAVEKTVAEYQEEICRSAEENERLRRLLDLVSKPEIKLHRAGSSITVISNVHSRSARDSRTAALSHLLPALPTTHSGAATDFQVLTPAVPPEQQNCEQEWSPSLEQEDPEPTQIKEEQHELRLSQEDPPQPSHLYQNQTVDDGERGILPIIITEEIKTEPDGEGYIVPEPTSDQPLSVHPDCSAAVEKPYRCKQCDKSFTRKGHLTIHSKIHTGEKSYLCKQCDKSFIQKGDLDRHTRVHTGDNPYQCKQCGKMFNQKGSLTIHSRIHTGEKPYQCKDCDKSFNQKMELILHMRVHTGERPYNCPVCKKSYMALSYLRLHQRVHTGEKPYQCKECGKCFGYKGSLKSHMSTHTKASA